MPLGGDLIDDIASRIEAEASACSFTDEFGRKGHNWRRAAEWTSGKQWLEHPIYGTVVGSTRDVHGAIYQDKAVDAHTQLQRLRDLLRNQTAETIDAFIAENPRISALAKLALAATMLSASYTAPRDQQALRLKTVSARMLTPPEKVKDSAPERNWIHLLINIVRHGIDEGQVTAANKVKIVTFNYDMILEHILDQQFSNREEPLSHYSNYFEILHVHGCLGGLEPQCTDPVRTAIEWSKGVNVVKEKNPSAEVATARARAKEIIGAAAKVYAIGFSFAGPNCRLLGLEQEPERTRTLTYCNYDGNRGIQASASRYFLGRSVEERAGEWSRPLSATNFIRAGFLGEPPS
jgi:hypothetical protein